MARPWRIEYEGAFYHVMSRGNDGQEIFYEDRDKRRFLDTIGEMSDRFDVDIFAYVLVSNHYHLLLCTTHANLSKAMQWLGVTYSRRFNNAHNRNGHLFQGRFKSILVENESYVVELSCYIHRNPLRAGMVKRLIDYKWSSYPAYAYGRKAYEWLTMDMILSFFSDDDPHKRYREKVQRYAEEEKRLWEDLKHGLILGATQFIDEIRSKYINKKPHREIPQQRGMVGRIDGESYLSRASELLGRDMNRFKQKQRLYGEERHDRDLLVYLLWQRGAFTNEEIGDFFGVSYSAVSHIVRRVRDGMAQNKRYQRRLKVVNSQIKI